MTSSVSHTSRVKLPSHHGQHEWMNQQFQSIIIHSLWKKDNNVAQVMRVADDHCTKPQLTMMTQTTHQVAFIRCSLQLFMNPDLSLITISLKHLILEGLLKCSSSLSCLCIQQIASLQQLHMRITAAISVQYCKETNISSDLAKQ